MRLPSLLFRFGLAVALLLVSAGVSPQALAAQGGQTDSSGPNPDKANTPALGYVLVTPDGPRDGGDFGKYTPGTKTAGIQDAIDFAVANHKNVFIAGVQFRKGAYREKGLVWFNGSEEIPGWYFTDETIHIPAVHGFHIMASRSIIRYLGKSGDALHIDSCMDCFYQFGLVTARYTDGAVVRLKPENPVPIDRLVGIYDSVFDFSTISGSGVVTIGTRLWREPPKSDGLVLDSSLGGIAYNNIFATAILKNRRGAYLTGKGVFANWIKVAHNQQSQTMLQVGDEDSASIRVNRIDMSLSGNGMPSSTGARIFGNQNQLTLDFANNQTDIIFEQSARDNLITALNGPLTVVNNAAHPTNRILSAVPVGFGIPTPPVPPSGEPLTNRNPYRVEIMVLKPGKVTGWTLNDAGGVSQALEGPLSAGQRILLLPGEGIALTYREPPSWRWRVVE
jgi:hypothetical protein